MRKDPTPSSGRSQSKGRDSSTRSPPSPPSTSPHILSSRPPLPSSGRSRSRSQSKPHISEPMEERDSNGKSRDSLRQRASSPEKTKPASKSVSPKLVMRKIFEEPSSSSQDRKDPSVLRARSWSGLNERLRNREHGDKKNHAMSSTASAPRNREMAGLYKSRSEHGALETRRRARRRTTEDSNKGNELWMSDHGAEFKSRRGKQTAENPFLQLVPMMVENKASHQNDGVPSKFDHGPGNRNQRRMEGSNVTPSIVASMVTTQPPRRMQMASRRNDMLRNMESEYKAAQEGKQQNDKLQWLRQQLNDAKKKWISIKVQGDSDVEACRRSLQEQKEKLLQGHMESMDKLEASTSASQELLRNENELLQAEYDELKTSLGEAQKGNVEYRAVQQQVQTSFDSLSAFVMKKTKDKKKLEATIEKLAMIQRGAMFLKIEAGIKNIYRRNVYRCLEAIHSADMFDYVLYKDVVWEVQKCEKEVGGDFLDEDGQTVLKSAGNQVIENEAPVSAVEHRISNENCTSITMDPVNEYENGQANHEDGDLDVAKFTQDAEKQSAAFSNLSNILHETQISSLCENRDMLVTIFKFLDKDGGGTIDREEFRMGVDLLNRRLPVTAQFQDANVLFEALDVDQSGEIDLDEFEAFFSQSANIADQMYGEW